MKVLKLNEYRNFDIISAGIILYRFNPDIEFFLVKPGGPFYAGRDRSYGMPKGEVDPGEENDILGSAIRELKEETGIKLNKNMPFINVGYTIEEYLNKKIYAFALEYKDEIKLKSISLTKHYDGKKVTFPEIEEGKWFKYNDAIKNIRPAQQIFIERLDKLGNKNESFNHPFEDWVSHYSLKFYTKVNLLNVAKEVCRKLNYDEPEYLGQGGYGVSFNIGDDIVLKLTSDEEEAQNAFFLLAKETEHIIEYYDVYKLVNDDIQNPIYALFMEFILPLTDEDVKMIKDIKEITGLWTNDMLKLLKDNEKELWYWAEHHNHHATAKSIVEGLFGIAEDCETYDISTFDVKAANMGWSGDGELIYFDVGATTLRDYKLLPKLKINLK
jgi:predicted NUDIX family NTP pyrophosphohydrolase